MNSRLVGCCPTLILNILRECIGENMHNYASVTVVLECQKTLIRYVTWQQMSSFRVLTTGICSQLNFFLSKLLLKFIKKAVKRKDERHVIDISLMLLIWPFFISIQIICSKDTKRKIRTKYFIDYYFVCILVPNSLMEPFLEPQMYINSVFLIFLLVSLILQ